MNDTHFQTEARAQAAEHISEVINARGVSTNPKECMDWVDGTEDEARIDEIISDALNDYHTDMCAEKNAWRYQ